MGKKGKKLCCELLFIEINQILKSELINPHFVCFDTFVLWPQNLEQSSLSHPFNSTKYKMSF